MSPGRRLLMVLSLIAAWSLVTIIVFLELMPPIWPE